MNTTNQLFEFLKSSVSPAHAVNHAVSCLEKAGFKPLDFKKTWSLEAGGAYYCRTFSGELFAFKTGPALDLSKGIHIGAAHTDWPCLRIKPAASYTKQGYLQANVEVYGGPILTTFLDRPLAIAGKLAVKGSGILEPDIKYIDLKKPSVVIPNIAIHMNRSVNDEGFKIDKQVHMMPLLGIVQDAMNTDDYLLKYIAAETGVDCGDILDYELCLYNPDEPLLTGIHEEFISSPRLDDITSVCALIHGLIESEPSEHVALTALFDNEEIGSQTKQGADSVMLPSIIEKIWAGFGKTPLECKQDTYGGMILSVDVGHGYHPNYPNVYDITTFPRLGGGFVIKTDSNQKYTWDCEAVGGLKNMCAVYDISYQLCVKRSNQAGGGTIGSLISSQLPLKTVDIGVPLLAMHSARELMGAADQAALTSAAKRFYSL